MGKIIFRTGQCEIYISRSDFPNAADRLYTAYVHAYSTTAACFEEITMEIAADIQYTQHKVQQ